MKYLTADFGSTYTKLAAIDSEQMRIAATSSAFTTVGTDIMEGFNNAMHLLEKQIGAFTYDELLVCSSAAGGLKMVALGLVPELTAKAANTAAASAGAKVERTFSFELTKSELAEIDALEPDLVLLCGGTDGGNKDVIISNARKISGLKSNFSVVVAGNKSASDEVSDILESSGKNFVITENVMPAFNRLNIEPARKEITKLFIERIIHAKGLSNVQAITPHKIIPTPLAVMKGCELLSLGTGAISGIGDLMAVDIGGATTDVYSMSKGNPSIENVLTKGLPEPYAKRSVEGDLGMRYSLSSLSESLDITQIALESRLQPEDIIGWIGKCAKTPNILPMPGSKEQKIEEILAKKAARIATERHCGSWESTYTPLGQVLLLTGKDLSEIPYVIGIGGIIANSSNPVDILKGVEMDNDGHKYAKPKKPLYMVDKRYIFAAMGLISQVDKELALSLMKSIIVPQQP